MSPLFIGRPTVTKYKAQPSPRGLTFFEIWLSGHLLQGAFLERPGSPCVGLRALDRFRPPHHTQAPEDKVTTAGLFPAHTAHTCPHTRAVSQEVDARRLVCGYKAERIPHGAQHAMAARRARPLWSFQLRDNLRLSDLSLTLQGCWNTSLRCRAVSQQRPGGALVGREHGHRHTPSFQRGSRENAPPEPAPPLSGLEAVCLRSRAVLWYLAPACHEAEGSLMGDWSSLCSVQYLPVLTLIR